MSRERERYDEIGKKIKREIDASSDHHHHHQIMGRRHILGGPGPPLNTTTPCAACKLLRRRCAEECPFSPYFSPHEPHKFAAVHKVFGASNVSKMLMEVAESQRADAANSLVYEANVRLRDPVYGCMGLISALQQQVQTLQAEVDSIRAEILTYKYREAASNIIASTHHAALVSSGATVSSDALIMPPPAIIGIVPSHPPPPPPPPPPLPSIFVSSSSSSSTLYTLPATASTTGYNSIPSDRDRVLYFD